jgi:pimeloyl-ACP methyl ester carboxylesterase
VAWHLMDSPRGEAALAAALPLAGVPAWRVYFGLPNFGGRLPPGGVEEIISWASEDYVLKVIDPVVSAAAAEFPAALAALCGQLPLEDGPVGLVGGSAGGAVALLVLAEQEVAVSAAAVINPLVQLEPVVPVIESTFGFVYPWTDEARAAAARLDFVARAEEIAARHPGLALLLVGGERDEPAFREPLAQLRSVLRGHYADKVSLVEIPDMGHGFALEPGLAAAPQTADAVKVDAAVTDWFRRHLV